MTPTLPTRLALAAALLLTGCSAPAPTPKPDTKPKGPIYPTRPTVAAPAFKVFHQDDDTYTLVTKPTATDDEISAILWQLRDATFTHTFDRLHLSQKFVDARKPSIWFHVYRGPKCAAEKFIKGKYPCGASYHGAGDFTLGGYKNPLWDDGVLLHENTTTETHLWDSDAPYTPPQP